MKTESDWKGFHQDKFHYRKGERKKNNVIEFCTRTKGRPVFCVQNILWPSEVIGGKKRGNFSAKKHEGISEV